CRMPCQPVAGGVGCLLSPVFGQSESFVEYDCTQRCGRENRPAGTLCRNIAHQRGARAKALPQTGPNRGFWDCGYDIEAVRRDGFEPVREPAARWDLAA